MFPTHRAQRRALAALAVLLFLFSWLRFDGPSRGYWDTYISVPAMFMTGQRVELLRIDGTPRFQYTLKGKLPDDTYDPSPGGFGIASEDQRIGTAILFAAPFALGNLAVFRLGYALSWTLLFLFGFLCLRRLLDPSSPSSTSSPPGPSAPAAPLDASLLARPFAVPTAGALLLVLNPFSLSLDRLNGNLFGLSILVFLFFLLLDEHPVWWMVGLVYGLVGGVRNEAIVLAPMLLAFLWHRRGTLRGGAIALTTFTAAALAGIFPVLLWNRFAYGKMLIHPSQVAHLEGFRPTFPHHFFGSTFAFNGLLNVPFHDRLVRTPHFGYPTSLLWPLVTARCFGVILCALAILGVAALLRRRRFEAGVLLFWYAIYYGLFFAQENWEDLKQTFMALHLFPLLAFMTAGIDWLAERPRDRLRVGLTVGLSAALVGAVLLARRVDVPADERWYVRFPHAARNESGLAELPEERRSDWHFFYTREVPAEAERERRTFGTPTLWPLPYRPFHVASRADLAAALREPWQREHTTLAIWSYIYE